jgi:hypothetical protein
LLHENFVDLCNVSVLVYLAIGYYGLEKNGSHQLLVYVNDVNLLGGNMNTTKKSTGTLLDFSLEVNAEKIEYMFMSRHQIAGQNRNIKIRLVKFFYNVVKLKYLQRQYEINEI